MMAKRPTASSTLFMRLPGKQEVPSPRAVLARSGVQIDEAGHGKLKLRNSFADVTLETDGFITVRADVNAREDAAAALERGATLPGTARFAVVGRRWRLAAETRADGIAHLPESMADIRRGFGAAFAKHKPRRAVSDAKAKVEAAVREAIEASGWTEEQCVKTDDGIELQPRLAGEAVPVRVCFAEDGVHASRSVLEGLPDECPARQAVSHQALMFNDRLRFTRLAIANGKLVVESRLRAGLIDADWLEFTARAVAAAAQQVTPTLRVLAQEVSLSKTYAEFFLES